MGRRMTRGRWRAVWVLMGAAAVAMGGCAASPGSGRSESVTYAEADLARRLLESVHAQSIEQIIACSQDDDPFMRANAIEASQYLPDRVVPLVQLALEDSHEAVRFAALATVGRRRLTVVAPVARTYLSDPSRSVRAAAIFALAKCGQAVDRTPLAAMLADPDLGVRGNAAMLVGMMDDPTAVPMLKDMAKAPMQRIGPAKAAIVRLQFAEAIARLGDDSNLSAIRAGAYSKIGEVRVLAVTMMGELNDQAMAPAIAVMLSEPPMELQVAAAATLAKFGDPSGLRVVMLASHSALALQRHQAALALGYFDAPGAVRVLTRLLNDEDRRVRLSAAAAICRRLGG